MTTVSNTAKIKKTYSGQANSALCLTCREKWKGRNALGVAAIHVEAFGHRVSCSVRYDVDMEPK